MHVRWLGVYFAALVMMLPLFSAAFATPVLMNAQAADACQGDTEAIQWNRTMQRMAEVPHYSDSYNPYYYEDDYMYYDGEPPSEGEAPIIDVPEESWMYQQNQWNLPVLDPLDMSHYTTMLIGNDSVGALRLNLSATHRTTICVTLQDTDSNPVVGDVYLMTTQEYETYVSSYQCAHSQSWFCFGDGELEESLSDIPPEWRSWNPLGWKSYRDAHEYEGVSSVNFALNLDKPEVYTPIWGGSDWQDFYLVVDTWDNIHDADAEAPGITVAADVTVVTTERSLVLPSYTVALAFMAMLLGGLAAPFILNARYMKAGLVSELASDGLVPSLDRPAELAPFPHPPVPVSTPVVPVEEPPVGVSAPVNAINQSPPPPQLEGAKSYENPFDL